MKRYISALLIVCLLVLPVLSMTASAETYDPLTDDSQVVNKLVSEEEILYESAEENGEDASGFRIRGIDYFTGMDMVTDQEQMNYTMDISQITYAGDQINLSAVYQGEDEIGYPLEISAIAYQTEIIPLKSRGGITAVPVESNLEIISFSLVREAHSGLLFPAHEHFEGKSILSIVLKKEGADDCVYFEGLLPDDFEFGTLAEKAVRASDKKNDKKGRNRVHRIAECIESFDNSFQTDESEVVEVEVVQDAELWMLQFTDEENLPDYDGDTYFLTTQEETCDSNAINRKAKLAEARESETRIPFSVFKQIGNWKSTNNPDVPEVGYYAQTTSLMNGPNKVTKLISWEYLYQDPQTLTVNATKNNGSTRETTTSLKVIYCGYYWYDSNTGKVDYYSSDRRLRIKNAAVAVGLQANTEILSKAKPSARINKASWEIDWKFYIGLVSKELATAANILDKISVYKEKSEGSINYDLQDTKKGQVNVYGYVVRAVKSAAGDGYLDRKGDHVSVQYVITHPADITKSVGSKTVTSKYYFEVHDTDAWGIFNKRFSATEYRYRTYLVR